MLSGVKWQENGAFVSESRQGLLIGHPQRERQIGNACAATMHFLCITGGLDGEWRCVLKIPHCVLEYTMCVTLHIVCKITQFSGLNFAPSKPVHVDCEEKT